MFPPKSLSTVPGRLDAAASSIGTAVGDDPIHIAEIDMLIPDIKAGGHLDVERLNTSKSPDWT